MTQSLYSVYSMFICVLICAMEHLHSVAQCQGSFFLSTHLDLLTDCPTLFPLKYPT